MFSSAAKSYRCQGFALVGLIVVMVSAPSLAGIYKCTDGAGRKTYSDKPCDGQIEIVDPMKVGTNTVSGPKANIPSGTRQVPSPQLMPSVARSSAPQGSYQLTSEEEQRLKDLRNPKALSSVLETKTLTSASMGQ
jgi:hypothetical protein